MEQNMKKFTVVNSLTQTKREFETNMTTTDELFTKLRSLGMDLTNTTIREALSNTIILAGKTLPHDVEWKGTTTNNLVFRITLTNKKTDSGASRQEIIATIKANGWGEDIKKKFGKNFTNCKTADLEFFIASRSKSKPAKVVTPKKEYSKPTTKVAVKKEEATEGLTGYEVKDIEKAVAALANLLESNGFISAAEKATVFEYLTVENTSSECYSEEELSEILGD